MSGHHPWPPSSAFNIPPALNDLDIEKSEVFRFGNWSIYNSAKAGVGHSDWWVSFIMHCRTWKEWTPIEDPISVNTWVKNESVNLSKPRYLKREVIKRCNESMTAYNTVRCPGCLKKIPKEVVALWTLQNFDKIQEANNA